MGLEGLREIGDQVAAGAFAGGDAGDLVVGAVGRKVETRVLADGQDEIGDVGLHELAGQAGDVEGVHAPVPLVGGDADRLQVTGGVGEKAGKHPPAAGVEPVGVGALPGAGAGGRHQWRSQ